MIKGKKEETSMIYDTTLFYVTLSWHDRSMKFLGVCIKKITIK